MIQPGPLGLIVNPIAGIGGRFGLKGSDGEAAAIALAEGAPKVAPTVCKAFLRHLKKESEPPALHTWAGDMGATECADLGIPHTPHGIRKDITGPEDTVEAVDKLTEAGVQLLIIVGGDGTARDAAHALKDRRIPVIGVPAGVKIYSTVYANTPKDAASLVHAFLRGHTELQETVVLDVDEEELRRGNLRIREDGTLYVPSSTRYLSGSKTPSPAWEEASKQEIAEYVIDEFLYDDTLFLVGPGTTTKELLRRLGYTTNLLGIDLLKGKTLLQADMSEDQILGATRGKPVTLILTPIGGQGFILKRNQPITQRVLRQTRFPANLLLLATPHKLATIPGLKADLDPDLTKKIPKYLRVVVGRDTQRVVRFLR